MGRRLAAWREEFDQLRKRKRTTVTVSGAAYEIRARAYARFGEEAFEVRLRRLWPRAVAGPELARLASRSLTATVGLRASDSEPAL